MNNSNNLAEIFEEMDDIILEYNEKDDRYYFLRQETGEIIDITGDDMHNAELLLSFYSKAKDELQRRKEIADKQIEKIRKWRDKPAKRIEWLKHNMKEIALKSGGKISLPQGTISIIKGRKHRVEVDPEACKQAYAEAKRVITEVLMEEGKIIEQVGEPTVMVRMQ